MKRFNQGFTPTPKILKKNTNIFGVSLQSKRGFTLIEILLVIVMMAVLVTMVVLSFNKLGSSQALDKSATTVVSVLSEARALTLSASQDARYGVSLQDNQVVLFRGATYATSTTGNVFTPLHPSVGIRNVSLAGGASSVVFNRLTGGTSQTGTFEVYLRSATTTFKTVTVSGTGIIEEE